MILGHYGVSGLGKRPLAMFRTIVLPNGVEIRAEVAIEPEDMIRGLMFREQIDSDEGMLFIHPHAGLYPIWMKHTLIPLDVLWLSNAGRIVEMAQGAQPCKSDDCPQYGGRVPSSYTIEVCSGTIKRNLLKLGDRIMVNHG
jgi:uncharacterized protein